MESINQNMKKIQMVDLQSQYHNIKDEVDKSIQEVINNTFFINGEPVKNFASNLEKYLDVKNVIPCGNGTDALQIALMALDLKPGDEVITVPFTFIATVEAIAILGLKVVYVDIDPNTYTIDVNKIEEAITPQTKAILPVHLYGQCAEMDKLMSIAQKHNLKVIEDTAQALGASYKVNGKQHKAGTIGDIGCTSFFPSKNLGCFGDGGAIMTNNDELASKIRMIVNHGSKVKYYHETIGVNSRLDTIQAAILNIKLQHLDNYNKSRKDAADFYNSAFSKIDEIITPERNYLSDHIYHQYTIRVPKYLRVNLKNQLGERGIPSMIYYPVCLHLQKAYSYLGYKEGDFPLSEKYTEEVLSLPMHTELSDDQLEYITSNVIEIINELK